MITVGGSAVATPALTRAIREFGEQAKKQLEETGSLAGFEGKFTDDSGGDGSVTVTISALGAAAYGAGAGKDDTILAYTLTTAQPDGGGGTATSLSSGSSEIIKGDQDVDTFTARFQGATDTIHFGAFVYGTPEELAAAGLGPLPQPGVPDPIPALAGDAKDKAAEPSSELFAKLQQKQAASSQLIGLLQSFADALSGQSARERSKRESDHAGAAETAATTATDGGTQNAIRDRLTRFAGTDVTT